MDYRVSGESLTAVADAIRAKAGTTEAMEFPDGFVNGVLNMSSGEKWELLADITTTEEVNSILVNTDMNGNAFICNKIKAQMVFPSVLSGGAGVYFGGCAGLWMNPGFMTNQDLAEGKHHYYGVTAHKGLFTEFRAGYSSSAHFGGRGSGIWYRIGDGYTGLLERFFICRTTETEVYPVGTRLIVWGVKA